MSIYSTTALNKNIYQVVQPSLHEVHTWSAGKVRT